jgi:hypothetical protein
MTMPVAQVSLKTPLSPVPSVLALSSAWASLRSAGRLAASICGTRPVLSSSTCSDGWIWGRGGCRIASRCGSAQVGNACPRASGGFRSPDGVQEGQVVGIGQGLPKGPGRRQLLAVAAQYLGEHLESVLVLFGFGGRVIVCVGGGAVVAG